MFACPYSCDYNACSHTEYMPSTPSPCFSERSLASSMSSPRTPCSPSAPVPALYAQYASRIHQLLHYFPNKAPSLIYDVTEHPLTARLAQGGRGALRMNLAEPATQPPMERMVIVCKLLPYAIRVRPGAAIDAASPVTSSLVSLPPAVVRSASRSRPEGRRSPYVTVVDILIALHEHLSHSIDITELMNMPLSQQATIMASCTARRRSSSNAFVCGASCNDGPRRADILVAAGRTQFLGLGATKGNGEVWMLNLA
jgi:hypothetical protein